MDRLLILGAGEAQAPAIRRARQRGLHVIAIDPHANAAGLQFANEVHCHDLGNVAACLRIAEAAGITGVMTLCAEYPLPTVAAIREAMQLPGLSVAAARRSTNKKLMRDAFVAANIPTPEYDHVLTSAEAEIARRRISGPCIVKPATSHGGRGVTLISPAVPVEDFHRAVEHARCFSQADGVMIESYVDGSEFSVETVSWHGETTVVAITAKTTTGAPYFVEIGHSQPADLAAETARAVRRAAIAGVRALGIDHSPAHVELRVTENGPVIIEIGARLGGGYICSDLVPLSTGVDLICAAIDLALGRPPSLQPTIDQGAAIRFLRPLPGMVVGIDGVDDARQLEGCRRISLQDLEIGSQVKELRDATTRRGYVIFTGPDRTTAMARANRAIQTIQVKTAAD